eukprot:4897118-Pyramimonas_sp.AAC.1
MCIRDRYGAMLEAILGHQFPSDAPQKPKSFKLTACVNAPADERRGYASNVAPLGPDDSHSGALVVRS